ncbi:MerR family transcriptional regulator [Saccharopolyspora phatthalungensis]|uniref:MerR family transcriptional regulator n=1 Tax=Saccharopolyspora phatthalungensis TaxID=664693 RepID=UPI000AF499DE|nr:MerR family transcriptional regulator [Saccharopolyspora phatthalungensis]
MQLEKPDEKAVLAHLDRGDRRVRSVLIDVETGELTTTVSASRHLSSKVTRLRRVAEYRIGDLARAAGTTVRNVRVYQDRELLPPPRRQGRMAIYSDAHLVRLRLIIGMLERGYALAQIKEMLAAWESGRSLADVLGVAEVSGASWAQEAPRAGRSPGRVADEHAQAPHGDLIRTAFIAPGKGLALCRAGEWSPDFPSLGQNWKQNRKRVPRCPRLLPGPFLRAIPVC